MNAKAMPNRSDVSAVILAGGLGSRLRSVVSDRQKIVAGVGGRPFVYYILDQLSDAGFQHVILCTGYRAQATEALIGCRYGSLDIYYSRESAPLGTGGALALALSRVQTSTVLAMNGDSYCEVCLSELLTWHHAVSSPATMVVSLVSDASRYGRVEVGENCRVTAFCEKDGVIRSGTINAGVYVLGSAACECIRSGGVVSLERDLFPALIDTGLFAYRSSGRFIDIGTPESYSAAERLFTANDATDL